MIAELVQDRDDAGPIVDQGAIEIEDDHRARARGCALARAFEDTGKQLRPLGRGEALGVKNARQQGGRHRSAARAGKPSVGGSARHERGRPMYPYVG